MRKLLVLALLGILSACASSGTTPDSGVDEIPPTGGTHEGRGHNGSMSTKPSESSTLDEVAARAAHTATALPDGRVFVAGGCVADGCGDATLETFLVVPAGTRVLDGPDMGVARDSHTATLAGQLVVLAGGFAGEGRPPSPSVEVFDPTTDSIVPIGDLEIGRGGHAAAPLPDGRVLVVGGWVAPSTYTSSTEIIDPEARTIAPGPDLPVAADALDAVALADGTILVTGGQIRSGIGTDQAHVYDPDSGTWSAAGPMTTPRFKHFSLLLADGSVLVLGGTTDDRTILRSTEIFDPTTTEFRPGPDLTEPRYKMTGGAVVVHDEVVVGGGGRTVEVLDMSSDESRVLADFGARGSFATLTPLGAKELIMLGGYDDTIALRGASAVFNLADLQGAARS